MSHEATNPCSSHYPWIYYLKQGSVNDNDSAEEPPLFMRKTPSPKKVSNECGNVQPRANSARLRGVTITDGENRECRLTRGFFSTIDNVMFSAGCCSSRWAGQGRSQLSRIWLLPLP